jgi:hypothetical protein
MFLDSFMRSYLPNEHIYVAYQPMSFGLFARRSVVFLRLLYSILETFTENRRVVYFEFTSLVH